MPSNRFTSTDPNALLDELRETYPRAFGNPPRALHIKSIFQALEGRVDRAALKKALEIWCSTDEYVAADACDATSVDLNGNEHSINAFKRGLAIGKVQERARRALQAGNRREYHRWLEVESAARKVRPGGR